MDEPATTLISVAGIRAMGRHGANAGERDVDQDFVIDARVWVEVEEDSLRATLDYRTVVEIIRDTVATTSFELLESLALSVATALVQLKPVRRATAVVHKPLAAASMSVVDVFAEATVDAS
jgi:dihydroneopterin aldolase